MTGTSGGCNDNSHCEWGVDERRELASLCVDEVVDFDATHCDRREAMFDGVCCIKGDCRQLPAEGEACAMLDPTPWLVSCAKGARCVDRVCRGPGAAGDSCRRHLVPRRLVRERPRLRPRHEDMRGAHPR